MKLIITVYLVILTLIALAGSADYGPITMREGANITMSSGYIKNLANGTEAQDAVTYSQMIGHADKSKTADGYVIKDGSNFKGYVANGTLISSSATDIGAVANAVLRELDSRIGLTAWKKLDLNVGYAPLLTSIEMNNYTVIDGLGTSWLYNNDLTTTMMKASEQSNYHNQNIRVLDLILQKTNSSTPHTGNYIEFNDPVNCYVENCQLWMACTTFSASNTGLCVYFNGAGSSQDWMNYMRGVYGGGIKAKDTTDLYISDCNPNTWNATYAGIDYDNVDGGFIDSCHIMATKIAGILLTNECSNLVINNNMFENGMGTTGDAHGIYILSGGALLSSIISNNRFFMLRRCGILATGDMSFCAIEGNCFNNNNGLNANYHDDIRIEAESLYHGTHNAITGNVHIEYGRSLSKKGVAIREVDSTYDPDYNSIVGNNIFGEYSAGVTKVGGNSISEHNVALLT